MTITEYNGRVRALNIRTAREQRGRFWYMVFLTCVAVALFGYAFAP